MSLLSNYSTTKENKGNALKIGAEARYAKSLNPNIIDSTIGMLFDENGEFFTFNCVKEAEESLSSLEKFAYGSSSGDPRFHNALYKWVFRDLFDDIKSSVSLRCVATPGGSGAICTTFANYLDRGQKVLLPSLMWTNYTQIAKEEGLGFDTYLLFDEEGNFNTESLKAKCLELKKSQGRVLIVINDPCQNPTGYSMKYNEWVEVVNIINEVSNDGTPVVLLYDMAYIDYDKRGFDASRKNIELFTKLNENALAILAFSGSKTLGLYGLRIGAQICMAKSEASADDFLRANDYSARGKWSGSSTLGQAIIRTVLEDYSEEFSHELNDARRLLISRAEAFIKESELVGLKHYPYDCGFFVTIPCENPHDMFERLKEKGLYILPLENAIRLTLSSITLEEVKRAVHIIKETI